MKQNLYCIAAASATVQKYNFKTLSKAFWAVLTINKCIAIGNATIFLYTFFSVKQQLTAEPPLQSSVSCVVVVLTTTSCI